MGKNTKIPWSHHTFSPWWGCTRISPGCGQGKSKGGCYAETFSRRLGKALWGPTADRPIAGDSYWMQPLKWDLEAKKSGKQTRVFCASMCDIFEDRDIVLEARERLLWLVTATPHLSWMFLTKRPENMVRLARLAGWTGVWPRNVWAGCTVESQWYIERIRDLMQVPAAVRFISCEPQLDDIDLRNGKSNKWAMPTRRDDTGNPIEWTDPGENFIPVDLVITGGESGGQPRPYDIAWAYSLQAQCEAANVSFFAKQLGANPVLVPGSEAARRWLAGGGCKNIDSLGRLRLKDRHAGEDMTEWAKDLRVRQFPKGMQVRA